MWIRSQGGNVLINAKKISIEPIGNKYAVSKASHVVVDGQIVAEYDTQAEALKVIDMLQDSILTKSSECYVMPAKGVVL